MKLVSKQHGNTRIAAYLGLAKVPKVAWLLLIILLGAAGVPSDEEEGSNELASKTF